MGTVNSELEELFQEKKRVRNPFVPVGAFITAGVLTAGLISFRREFSFGSETDESSCGSSRCHSCANGWNSLLLW